MTPKKLLGLALLLLSGCVRVGPNYRPPVAQVENGWTEDSSTVKPEPVEIDAWWLTYCDHTLNAMILFAMEQNYTLEAAVDRIRAARANLGIAIGELYPQTFQLEGSALRFHLSQNAPNTARINRNYWDITIGQRIAWELDFWGRFERGIEAAYGEFRASIDDYQNVKRLLISDIVLAYVQLKIVYRRIATLDSNIAIQHRSVEITEARYESGFESELDHAQASALWKQTESLKEVLEIQEKQLITSIALLLGLTPEGLLCLFEIDDTIPLKIPKLAKIGFPAEILCRRPDVRQGRDLIFAQNARVGIAVSDLYPRISFTGFLGFESTSGRNLFSCKSLTYFFGPSFTWTYFSFGRIENNIRLQYALLCEQIALYRNQVLVAFKEVEDAITFFARSIDEARDLEQSFASAKRSVDISTLQYQEGIADYSRVLNSLQLQVSIEDQMVQAEGDIALGYANIFRTLGVF